MLILFFSNSILFQVIERSVENYAKERSSNPAAALTFPTIHTCIKDMEPRLQLFRNIVRENPYAVEKMSNLDPEHPLASNREMVSLFYIHSELQFAKSKPATFTPFS